jgi:hypothetical protein
MYFGEENSRPPSGISDGNSSSDSNVACTKIEFSGTGCVLGPIDSLVVVVVSLFVELVTEVTVVTEVCEVVVTLVVVEAEEVVTEVELVEELLVVVVVVVGM